MSLAVDIQDLHKQFPTPWGRRGVYALKGVSLQIQEGQVYGLIGPNGSGKSTMMKILVGLLAPSSGKCQIFGKSNQASENRQNVGFLPENPYFYKFLTGAETLAFYGKLCGLRGRALRTRVDELLELVGLQDAARRRLGGYSKGMLQRIGLAQALVQSPRLIVLDEPTAGVDPLGSRSIRDIIVDVKQLGVTVFLCSHLLEQVQEICDSVGILYQGLMLAEGSVGELTQDQSTMEIKIHQASPELMARLQEVVKGDGKAEWMGSTHAQSSLEEVFLTGIRRQMALDVERRGDKHVS